MLQVKAVEARGAQRVGEVPAVLHARNSAEQESGRRLLLPQAPSRRQKPARQTLTRGMLNTDREDRGVDLHFWPSWSRLSRQDDEEAQRAYL